MAQKLRDLLSPNEHRSLHELTKWLDDPNAAKMSAAQVRGALNDVIGVMEWIIDAEVTGKRT